MLVPVRSREQRGHRRGHARDEHGITSLELFILFVLLGALSVVAFYSLGPLSRLGVRAACRTDVHNVETAVAEYRAVTNHNPTAMAQLVPTYLYAAPSSTHYRIAIDTGGAGRVLVIVNSAVPDSRAGEGVAACASAG